MNSIGERLRQERLRKGLDLENIAERTKIGSSFLEAIEAGDTARLPGAFFTRSFVRQYARTLGLDENEFDSDLSLLIAREPAAPERSSARYLPPPIDPPRRRSHGLQSVAAAISFLTVIGGLSGVFVVWQRGRDHVATATPPAARQGPIVKNASFAPAAVVQAPPSAAPAPVPNSVEPSAPAPAEPARSAGVRVELKATATTWIRVIADGKDAFIGNVEPGDAKTFEAEATLNIRAGNAGGVEAVWNGKPLGGLGPTGQVRTVEFTREAFRFVGAPAPSRPKAPSDVP